MAKIANSEYEKLEKVHNQLIQVESDIEEYAIETEEYNSILEEIETVKAKQPNATAENVYYVTSNYSENRQNVIYEQYSDEKKVYKKTVRIGTIILAALFGLLWVISDMLQYGIPNVSTLLGLFFIIGSGFVMYLIMENQDVAARIGITIKVLIGTFVLSVIGFAIFPALQVGFIGIFLGVFICVLWRLATFFILKPIIKIKTALKFRSAFNEAFEKDLIQFREDWASINDIKEYLDEKNESINAQYDSIMEEDVVGEDLFNSAKTDILLDYFNRKLADTVKEAIKLYYNEYPMQKQTIQQVIEAKYKVQQEKLRLEEKKLDADVQLRLMEMEPVICLHCGTKNNRKSTNCVNCGARLG